MLASILNCARIPAAFDAIADVYDEIFTDSEIGKAQRSQVWREADQLFPPGQRILEINCGTGVDAMHLAERGLRVLACDSSPGMIAVARRRLAGTSHGGQLEFRVLPTEEIALLRDEAPFEGLLSNFAGLNCVEDLRKTARDLALLLKPGAKMLLCVFGRHCAWEIAWHVVRGDRRKAFRRFQRPGSLANLGNESQVQVRYPSVRMMARLFAPVFRLKQWCGVGIAVPPSSFEHLTGRFPRAFHMAAAMDAYLGRTPILRGLADHILLTFERVVA